MCSVSALILAGGRGTRMGALCQDRPKPALSFAGNYCIIDFSLSNCVNSGIERIGVLTDYQRSFMRNCISRWQPVDAGHEGPQILEPRNGSYAGTADAVYRNLDHLDNWDGDNVLILAADHAYEMDYRRIIAAHETMEADVTVGIVSVPMERASQFGTVTLNHENRIVGFVEKPNIPTSNLVSMGIYIFRKQALVERLAEDAANPNSTHDFGHAIIPRMVGWDRVFAHQFGGYWRDVGTPEAYHKANLDLRHMRPLRGLNGKRYPMLVDNIDTDSCHIKDSVISQGCVVSGYVENSVLSPGVWIEENAVVKNSVVMANASIGAFSTVENTIVGEGVNIEEFCQIGSGARPSTGRIKVTVLAHHTKVLPYSIIDENREMAADALIADGIR